MQGFFAKGLRDLVNLVLAQRARAVDGEQTAGSRRVGEKSLRSGGFGA